MKGFELIAAAVAALLFPVFADAQDFVGAREVADAQKSVETQKDTIYVPEGYELVDSVVYLPSARVDTALAGKSIFSLLPSKMNGGKADVHVYQSQTLVDALKETLLSNSTRPVGGYRVRIFFDNRQTARVESEAAVKAFSLMYPGVPAYRSYVNPYFKVTVGDFRSKSEAMQFLREITGSFPKAFIVREAISYPAVDKENAYIVDTLQFLRPVRTEDLLD